MEQKTERTGRAREVFVGVRCAPSLNPPSEPDAATTRTALATATRMRRSKRSELPCFSGAEKSCGGCPKGEGNSINEFQLFSAGGLHYFVFVFVFCFFLEGFSLLRVNAWPWEGISLSAKGRGCLFPWS
jgi:hypothetical protein